MSAQQQPAPRPTRGHSALDAGATISLRSQYHPRPSCPSIQSKLLTSTAHIPQNARAIMAPTGKRILRIDQVPASTAKPISNQVAIGLRGRLSPTALIGVVPPATAPATARHVSGIVPPDMDNESKKPQRKSSGRRADQPPGPGQLQPITDCQSPVATNHPIACANPIPIPKEPANRKTFTLIIPSCASM